MCVYLKMLCNPAKVQKRGKGEKTTQKKKKKTHSLIGMLAKNHHLQKSLKKKRVGIKKEIRKIHVAKQKGEECKEAGRKHRPERERRDEKKNTIKHSPSRQPPPPHSSGSPR